MKMPNKTVLLFGDNDFSTILASDLKYTKEGFTCWVVNGCYYLKWEAETISCCRQKLKNIKSRYTFSGYDWVYYADWDNPVTIVQNVPFPHIVNLNYHSNSDRNYNEIINLAIQKFNDPDNYVEIPDKEDLTFLEGEDTIPF